MLLLLLRHGVISFHFAKLCHPDIPARSALLSTLPCQCPKWVTYDQLRKKDVSPLNRSIMKKQAHYTPDTPIKASAQAAGFLREDLRSLDHEESWILLLNGAHLPLAKKMITVGTIKSTQIDHRRIIKEALMTNATSIILFHNHPSGNPAPSVSDINETNKLRKACDIFDISLLDHIIVTDKSYYSFADETQNKF